MWLTPQKASVLIFLPGIKYSSFNVKNVSKIISQKNYAVYGFHGVIKKLVCNSTLNGWFYTQLGILNTVYTHGLYTKCVANLRSFVANSIISQITCFGCKLFQPHIKCINEMTNIMRYVHILCMYNYCLTAGSLHSVR